MKFKGLAIPRQALQLWTLAMSLISFVPQPVCSSHTGLCHFADIQGGSWPRTPVLVLPYAGMLFSSIWAWLAPSFHAGLCALLPHQRGLSWVLCLRCTICLSVSFIPFYFSSWCLLFPEIVYVFGYHSLLISLTRLQNLREQDFVFLIALSPQECPQEALNAFLWVKERVCWFLGIPW